jgi:micrococcal nuclease
MRIRLAVLVAFSVWLAGAQTGQEVSISAAHAQEQEARMLGQVLAVIDGSTLRVRLDTGSTEIVRLRGIVVPAGASPAGTVGCFGPEAAARLAILAPAGSSIELDIDAPERDDDGRLLAYVWRQDAMLMVNEQLLAEGYAVVPPTLPDEYADQFSHAQDIARSHRLGRWSACPDE